MKEKEKIRKKLEYFLEKEIKVHIKRRNKQFWNGYIIKIEDEVLIIEDDKLGKSSIFLFDILDVEQYLEKEDSRWKKRNGFVLIVREKENTFMN